MEEAAVKAEGFKGVALEVNFYLYFIVIVLTCICSSEGKTQPMSEQMRTSIIPPRN